MKKIIALAIAAMMVVAGMFVFVGCGDDDTTEHTHNGGNGGEVGNDAE